MKPVSLDVQKIDKLHRLILEFNQERGWDPTFPDLAKSVVIEAAELLELFQWQSSIVDSDKMSPEFRQKVSHEVADIVWYIFLFCQKLDINLASALEEKYQHNSKKYPAEMFKGKSNSEYYYQRKAEYRRQK